MPQDVEAMDVQATVSRLFIYPVKSCAGIQVQQAVLQGTGLEWDRAWMVVDADGMFLSQRECARMVLVQPEITADALVLRAPGMQELGVGLQAQGDPRSVQVWDDTVQALDMGDAAALWFSDFLRYSGLRLVRFDPAVRRLSSPKWTQGVDAPNQFSDGFAVLVTTETAVEELNTRLQHADQGPVGVERFRPNVVLSGLDAHDEDHLDLLSFQELPAQSGQGLGAEMRLVKPCARCPIPNIDPHTAESSPAVSDALQTYRSDARLNGAITFGMNAMVVQGSGAVLRVGQAVGGSYAFAD
ncbi:MOSC domain-containing protein [Rhodoferax saidenbachensis]|uniref:MOSC domain-containing protein n=1 Tax=Rhodoferax saidenbachensis TaxID=1484693 RepID=A0A1P8KDH8_9BURK|nr:MOSC N-terminal beta barrel domain-containing protein [Rhodoferax saidenbachensis]APW44054.1 MOSC domain-containing protein [Rhodoferax saidenbachensis]